MTDKMQWGNKARKLTVEDVCRDRARLGDKRDLLGWVIEFFGEYALTEMIFLFHLTKKIGIPSHYLELWSRDVMIEEQVRLFNETLEELKVPLSKNR